MDSEGKSSIYYGWVIVAIGFLTMVVAYSLRYNFSVFYVAILNYFGWGRAETAAGFSINLMVYSLSCPIAGSLVDRFGGRITVPIGAFLFAISLIAGSQISAIWQFYLIIGLTAFGNCAMGYVAYVPIIANWFNRRRGMALGLLSAGVTASAIIAPVVQYLIAKLGWKGAFISLGCVSIFIVSPLASILLRPRKREEGLEIEWGGVEGKKVDPEADSDPLVVDKNWALTEWTPALALKTLRFWCLAFMCMTMGFYCYTILAHQVAYLTDAGYSRAFSAGVVSVFSVMATISSFCAFFSDYLGRELTFTLSSVCAFIGLFIMMLIKNALNPWVPYLYAIIFGYGYGLSIAMMAVISADLFQGKNYGAINGIFMSLFVIGGAIGPWLAGYIFDRTRSYDNVFPFLYCAIIASAVFVWFASPRKVRKVPGRAKN